MGFSLTPNLNFDSNLTSATDFQNSLNATASAAGAANNAIRKKPMEDIYETNRGSLTDTTKSSITAPLTNWYQALPYGFKFTPRDGYPITMYLPISPSNLTITTQFATNIITTLYGTVEEHSEQRYFDIIIDGNTGIAPTYTDITSVDKTAASRGETTGRKSFSAVETIPSGLLGGFFSKTIGVVNQALNKAADILAPQQNKTGVDITKTGYVAFHNFYKFFLYYKKDVSGELSSNPRPEGRGHPLIFMNYKDNNKYYCTIQRFVLKRSADNPLIYNYTIQMRAYKIQKLDDQFTGDDSLDGRKKALGLDGVKSSSVFGDIKNISNGAKTVFGAAAGGLNIFGS